ncbi:hypothetical protein Y032_0036g3276 [Ancylostoma ceylanicum]|uniref:Uncharacterized protein n=1 Tax=Ancylostoma ceylanicum TaxID=53326 RepID=A0A016UL83_9BILA|nr:hypothetical protein Y032_0036g3276 [Ancylostoma ceylanicum]
MELDNNSDGIPSFSLPQCSSPTQAFTLSKEAESAWRQELLDLQRSAPMRRSHSFDEVNTSSFIEVDNESGFANHDDTQFHAEGCTTCYPCTTSELNCYDDFWAGEECYRQVHEPATQSWSPPKPETDTEVQPQGTSRFTADRKTDVPEKEPKENVVENGRIVAGVLLVGLASVVICSLWSLIRLLPLVAIPALCLYRKNFISQDPSLINQNLVPKAGKENEGGKLPVESMDDITIRERITDLEMENERLVLELKKQRQTTEALLRQLEDFTSKSYGAESRIEKDLSRAV